MEAVKRTRRGRSGRQSSGAGGWTRKEAEVSLSERLLALRPFEFLRGGLFGFRSAGREAPGDIFTITITSDVLVPWVL